jgi:glucosamine 6-phosphate synthetase-like amidotransferase/phosphosugar isomerase protein
MCGIFAFLGRDPEPGLLSACIKGASRRGPHGHGWTVCRATGTHTERHLGSLDTHTGDIIAECSGLTGIVLGHARMATAGSWDNKDNLQPLPAGDAVVAHNGVIHNPDDLWPGTATDTIAFTRAYEVMRGSGMTAAQVLEKLLSTSQQHAWAIAIAENAQLIVHRHYHPLYYFPGSSGIYLSSYRFHPQAVLLAEDEIHHWGISA